MIGAAIAAFTASCEKKPVTGAHDTATAGAEPEAESEANVQGVENESDDSVALASSPRAATGAQAAGQGGAGLFAEASAVLATVTATSYSHQTHVSGTTYDVDCSGFLDVLLARAAPKALAELRAGAGVKRPLAKHFVQFFDKLSPAGSTWSRVEHVADLAPGDVVAWNKPADVTSTNTGHVMIVAARAQEREPHVWTLAIIDSSAAPHGKDDARKAAHATGVGRGTIVLETDAAGAPAAYRWSTAHVSKAHHTEIAMGRLR